MSTRFEGLRISQGNEYPAKPAKVITAFFDNFCLDDVHDYLNELLVNALIADNDCFDTGRKRSNAIFFCEQVWYLAQAVDALNYQHKKK